MLHLQRTILNNHKRVITRLVYLTFLKNVAIYNFASHMQSIAVCNAIMPDHKSDMIAP